MASSNASSPFTATASHELRTPLAVMRGAVELLETSAADRPGGGQSASAHSARGARDVGVHGRLARAVARATGAVRRKRSCDVNVVLGRVVEDQRSVSPGKRIVLEIEAGASLQVAAPESMVAMTIGNLVRNAVQHGTGRRGACRSEGHELVVTNSGTLPTATCRCASALHYAPRRPRHGSLPGAPDLRALRLGHCLERRAAGVPARVRFCARRPGSILPVSDLKLSPPAAIHTRALTPLCLTSPPPFSPRPRGSSDAEGGSSSRPPQPKNNNQKR